MKTSKKTILLQIALLSAAVSHANAEPRSLLLFKNVLNNNAIVSLEGIPFKKGLAAASVTSRMENCTPDDISDCTINQTSGPIADFAKSGNKFYAKIGDHSILCAKNHFLKGTEFTAACSIEIKQETVCYETVDDNDCTKSGIEFRAYLTINE